MSYQVYKKRIIRVNISLISETPDEIIQKIKSNQYPEDIISDTILIEENDIIIAKEKVKYEGIDKSFTFDKVL